MYCSISEAWNEENTMSSLAKRFNNEYFSNNSDLNAEYYRINSSNFNDNKEHFTQNSKINETVNNNIKKSTEKVISVNNNLVSNNKDLKNTPKKNQLDDKTCNELINKVISCDNCRSIIKKRLSLEPNISLDIFSNIFKNTNKEVVILTLIGLIIIILLDLFVKISKSLN